MVLAQHSMQGVTHPLHATAFFVEFVDHYFFFGPGDADLALIVLQVVQRLCPAMAQAVLAGCFTKVRYLTIQLVGP
ncbi:hypothetical protein D3C80_1710330 [compost metagenome]